jgi:hypothetical protein
MMSIEKNQFCMVLDYDKSDDPKLNTVLGFVKLVVPDLDGNNQYLVHAYSLDKGTHELMVKESHLVDIRPQNCSVAAIKADSPLFDFMVAPDVRQQPHIKKGKAFGIKLWNANRINLKPRKMYTIEFPGTNGEYLLFHYSLDVMKEVQSVLTRKYSHYQSSIEDLV